MLGTVVDDVSQWVVIGVGLTTIIGGIYAAGRWFRKQFQHAIGDVVDQMVDPLGGKLDHLHDCVERVGKDAVAAAAEAAQAVRTHSELMSEHIEADKQAFAAITEWRGGVDIALRNIQQGQV